MPTAWVGCRVCAQAHLSHDGEFVGGGVVAPSQAGRGRTPCRDGSVAMYRHRRHRHCECCCHQPWRRSHRRREHSAGRVQALPARATVLSRQRGAAFSAAITSKFHSRKHSSFATAPTCTPTALLEPPISHSGPDSVCSHTRIMWVNESSVYATMNTTPQSSPARDRFPSAVLVESGPACQGGATRGQCRWDAARETTPAKARVAPVAWGSPPKSREWLSPQLYR